MRNVVDRNKETGLQIVKLTKPSGDLVHYNVENTNEKPGTSDFVVAVKPSLKSAREAAGINIIPPEKQTLPKSAYPEQQTGFKRH